MAIRTNMRATASIVLEMDDAIKADTGAWSEYVEAGFDESKLKLEGEPTRFRLQRMTYDQRQHAMEVASAPDRREFIVRCCLLGVSGYERVSENGVIAGMPSVKFEDSQQWKRPIVSAEWMRLADFPTQVLVGLSAMGLMLSEGAIPFCEPSAPQSTATDTDAGSQLVESPAS